MYLQYRTLVHLRVSGLCCGRFVFCLRENLMKRRQFPRGCTSLGCQTLRLTSALWCWSTKSAASLLVNLFCVIPILMESATLLWEDWEISSPSYVYPAVAPCRSSIGPLRLGHAGDISCRWINDFPALFQNCLFIGIDQRQRAHCWWHTESCTGFLWRLCSRCPLQHLNAAGFVICKSKVLALTECSGPLVRAGWTFKHDSYL